MKPYEYEQVKRHIQKNFFFINPPDNNRLSNILEKAKFLVRRKGIKVLVIDPYNRLESEQGSKNETQYISEVLDSLTSFAQKYDVLVVLMAHPTKIPKQANGKGFEIPNLYNISGSANFYNKADFGIVVHRDKTENYTLVKIEKVKFRHLGEPGECMFKYNINNGRYTPIWSLDDTPMWDNSNYLIEKAELDFTQADIDANISFENIDDLPE